MSYFLNNMIDFLEVTVLILLPELLKSITIYLYTFFNVINIILCNTYRTQLFIYFIF